MGFSRLHSASVVTSCLLLAATAGAQNTTDPPPFDWSSLTPSTNLTWVDCYQSPLQCTRFSVPLNYSDPDAGSTALALIRVPSPLANTTSYRGPVLFNPGGPGGSGIEAVIPLGSFLQILVGQEFDLVSFDPRGIPQTTPAIEIWESTEEQEQYLRQFSSIYDISQPSWPTLPDRLKNITALNAMFNERADDVIQHVTTDNVARDMLSIMEAHGMDKLQYYGVSYGTALGSIFASMFPDKIERLLIDGVLDQEGFFSHNWTNNIVDADKTLQVFFEACIEGGPDLCAFYEDTPEDATKRWDALLDFIDAGNVPLSDNSTLDIQTFIPYVFSVLYSPFRYSELAQALSELEQGNSSALNLEVDVAGDMAQYTNSIRCTDGGPIHDTVEEFEDYWNQLQNATKYFAAAVSVVRPSCYNWAVTPDHFKGPIGAQNTSFPLMLIGNTADPATPLSAAKSTSSLFPGSMVLTDSVPGHSSLATLSKCVAKYINQYFVNGTLPEEGAFCDIEAPIFAPTNGTTNTTAPGSGEESLEKRDAHVEEFSQALREFQRKGIMRVF